MSEDKLYPLGERIISHNNVWQVRAKKTGEFRKPKEGEWYISGAIEEAYKAPCDMSEKFHIAEVYWVKLVTTVEVVGKYDPTSSSS